MIPKLALLAPVATAAPAALPAPAVRIALTPPSTEGRSVRPWKDSLLMDDMHDAPTPTLAVGVPQALIADAFSRLFREAGFRVVGSYADVETLIDKVERGHPDLVLIDPVIEEHDGRSSTLARLCEA